ncbi:thiamine pyrophosphate-binding protein [Azospirillum sp. RWY-5-1]|uniref:Thiamine pyrophosphate-binding protein n=1 Tax=Azospirillum oleiclasticum TaxID=2735135 RepID=A0ABX2TIK1_9PROT|nr:thiamine pyrophosphate-binding protein [Azospirillum oleiclasticum]NYZ23964.1 thiamine pyrophosphate-binding protein [Azospirillum oleiclasticum]
MKTNEAVLRTLIDGGIRRGFTLPGLGITWSLRAFHERRDEFDVVLARSEQSASVMAQVAGKLTGRPGLFMGQGPFASTTGAFGILEAYFSGTPMVVLTDTSCYDGFGQHGVYQTMTGDYGAGDVFAVMKTMTKFATYATAPEEAVYGMQLALKHAVTPRPGPAAVVMKSNIIQKELPETPRARLYPTAGYLETTPSRPDSVAVARLAGLIGDATCPVIIAGNGVYMSRAGKALQAFAQANGIAVASSYHGKGTIDETSDVAVGMMGTWGSRTANRMVKAADLVVVLGCSLGAEYTRFRDAEMIRPGDQTIVQVDLDPRNAGWVVPVDLAITGDVADVLEMLAATTIPNDRRADRLKAIAAIREENGYGVIPTFATRPGTVHYADIIRALEGFLTPDDLLTLDAGTNRIWATTSLRLRTPGQLVAPGGIGGMGWSTPAATGTKITCPERRVTGVIGDGGFAMTMDAVATAAERGLDVVYLVANNAGLGMVRDNLGNQRIAVDFMDHDFAKVAEGLGGRGLTITHADQLRDALEEAHRLGGPVVIDAKVDPAASHRDCSDY